MNTAHIKPVIVLAAAAVAALSLGPAHAETTTDLASIKSAMHGKCITAPAAGSNVAMFPCDGPTAARQRWAYDPVGGRVSLNDGTTCLDATDGGWISPVLVRPCGAGGPNQRWDVDSRGRFALRGVTVSGKPVCLTIDNGGREDGRQLYVTYCHRGENQVFRLDSSGAPGSSVSLEVDLRAPNAQPACLDVPAAAPTTTQLWACGGANHIPQRFTRTAERELRMGSRCVTAGNGQPGTPVTLATCNDGVAQQWNMNGHGELRGMNDLCPWTAGESNANGTRISMQKCSGALLGQLWTFRDFR